jgi:hypothetical protein
MLSLRLLLVMGDTQNLCATSAKDSTTSMEAVVSLHLESLGEVPSHCLSLVGTSSRKIRMISRSSPQLRWTRESPSTKLTSKKVSFVANVGMCFQMTCDWAASTGQQVVKVTLRRALGSEGCTLSVPRLETNKVSHLSQNVMFWIHIFLGYLSRHSYGFTVSHFQCSRPPGGNSTI